ncbi:MAG TPA: SPOR domain-containing protein [Rudaea sp.]|jgi:DedD protein|nr:SPOR domain-containing protein [Rudaea sp.]
MDSALKQRLLGAAVLIALAVIFVPMFLSNSPQKQESTTTTLDIPPEPDHKFETRTLPVAEPSAPVATTPAPAVNDPNKIVTVDTNAQPRIDAHPEDKTPAPVVATPPKPVAATPPKPMPAEPEPAPTATGRFHVNLGIYADQAHANALVGHVKKLGFAAAAEPTEYQGKSALRVRVGPFADRAAAETARLKIKQAEPKVPSSVVDSGEQSSADAPATAVASNRAGGWAVQLGAFKSEAEANKLRDRLRGANIASFVDKTGNGDTQLWRVRAGPYADRSGADSARGTIKQKVKVDGMIVTQP